jgi:diguanylate cyclase (GGDEF)-like protein
MGAALTRVHVACAALCMLWLSGFPEQAAALERVRLQLRWQHQFQFAGYYLAVDRGFYAEEGLDVELVEAAAGHDAIAEVTTGRSAFGIATSELLLARAHNEPVVAMAALFQHSPLVIVALRESGIESVHDLAGKRVALEHGSAELVAYLESEGVSESSLRVVDHPQDVAGLLRGEVDAMSAYITDEPFAIGQAGKEVRVFTPRAAGIDFYGEILFTSEAELSAHPERAQAFLRASLRGWKAALDDPESAIDSVLARSQRHTRDHLRYEARQTASLMARDIVEIGYMNPGRFRHIAKVYESRDLLPRDAEIDIDAFLLRPQAGLEVPSWMSGALALAVLLALVVAAGWLRSMRLARELSRANARWRAFAEASPQPTVIADVHWAVQYANPSARAMFPDERGRRELCSALANRDVIERLAAAHTGSAVRDVEVRVDDQSRDAQRWLSLASASFDLDGQRALLISISDVSARKAVEQSLRQEADTDPLTGVINRRRVFALLQEAMLSASQQGQPLAVAMLDLDRFKAINDRFGHALGDQVLVKFAEACRRELRRHDLVSRLGGEEFLLVFPDTDLDRAHAIGERLRERVGHELAFVDALPVGTTVSVGIAVARPEDDATSLVSRADAALYRAKSAGRNMVCVDTLTH